MAAKYATKGLFGKLVRDPSFWAPAIAVGAGAAATGAAAGVGKLVESRRRAKTYREMHQIHPSLKKRSPELVKRIYNSLDNVNPTLARDPMVAGAWVDSVIDSGGLDAAGASRAMLGGLVDVSKIKPKPRTREYAARIGDAVRAQVEAGFASTKRYDDLAMAHQQIKDIQVQHSEKQMKREMRDATRAFTDAANRLGKYEDVTPKQTQAIMDAVARKYSSDGAFRAQRLLRALRRG